MSFVDNFLEATATLPRKVVRILKLYLTVEQRAKNIEDNLKILREKYLKDLKEDKIENSEFILYTNEKYYKELLNLSDYKQNLIDELKYILKYKFINKIEQIIERGQLQEILNNKKPKMEKKEEKLLNKKTKQDTEIIIDDIENQEEKPYNPEEDKNLYCKCNQRSSGRMIMCDVCHKWFHYKCFNIDENSEPDFFYCDICNSEKNKENNNNSNNNQTKKKERNYKRKKIK